MYASACTFIPIAALSAYLLNERDVASSPYFIWRIVCPSLFSLLSGLMAIIVLAWKLNSRHVPAKALRLALRLCLLLSIALSVVCSIVAVDVDPPTATCSNSTQNWFLSDSAGANSTTALPATYECCSGRFAGTSHKCSSCAHNMSCYAYHPLVHASSQKTGLKKYKNRATVYHICRVVYTCAFVSFCMRWCYWGRISKDSVTEFATQNPALMDTALGMLLLEPSQLPSPSIACNRNEYREWSNAYLS